MAGVLFPMTNAVEAAVRDVLSGGAEYVQMSIDTSKEIINLEEKGRCALRDLPKRVPADKPRYHIFVFPHTHEGDFLKSIGEFLLHAIHSVLFIKDNLEILQSSHFVRTDSHADKQTLCNVPEF